MFHRILQIIAPFAIMSTLAATSGAQIVNNSATAETSEDSITVAVLALDSLGNPAPADSFFVAVFGGGKANTIVFSDSGAANTLVGLDTIRLAGKSLYYYSRKVADIDGSGANGAYAGVIIAKSNATALRTPTRFNFQIANWELADVGDSVGIAARNAKAAHDTLDNGFASLSPVRVSSADSSAFAHWVWNTPAGNHQTSGSFGDFIDAPISGLGAGSGAYSITIIARDTGNQQVIPGAKISAFNQSQTALLAVRATDNDGIATINLNNGSYLINVVAPGYIFPASHILTLSGPKTDTIKGYSFNPGAPVDPTLVRVYGFVRDLSGRPDNAAIISAALPYGVTSTGGAIVSPFAVTGATDSVGYFYLDLIPNSMLIPDTTLYEFTLRRGDGTILRKRLVAPNSASWRLAW